MESFQGLYCSLADLAAIQTFLRHYIWTTRAGGAYHVGDILNSRLQCGLRNHSI